MSLGHSSNHRQLVHHSLMKLRNGQFFGSPRHEPGSLLRHDRRDESGLLQQLDAHSIAGIEFFPLIARLRIVHPGIGKDSIHIGREEADLPKNLTRGMPIYR